MTYDEKHDQLQLCFLKKFEVFHQLTDNATGEEKQSAAYLKIKEEFEEINVEYQNFLMLVKGGLVKGTNECIVESGRVPS